MLKKIVGIITIIFIYVITVNAQSQGPSPGPRENSNPPQIQTTAKQQATESDKRGTEQSPLVVKTIPAPKTHEEIEQSRKEHNEKTTLDRSLVSYTGYLAIITFFLVIATTILGIIGWFQGKQLKRSVDYLANTERAYVFVRVFLRNSKNEKENILREGNNIIEVIATNYGKTPAIITSVQRFCNKFANKTVIDDLFNEMDRIASKNKASIPPSTVIIGSGESRPIYKITLSLTDEDIHKINWTEKILVACLGIVQYEIIFNVIHKTTFCWQWEPNYAFGPDGSKHNYYT